MCVCVCVLGEGCIVLGRAVFLGWGVGSGGCLYRCWGQGLSVQVGGAVYGMVVVAVFLGLLEMGWGRGGGYCSEACQ